MSLHFGTSRVPTTQAAMPPSHSTPTMAELQQAKNVWHLCMLGCFGYIQLFGTLWTIAYQASLSVGFSRLEYWSGLPVPSPGIFPTQESNPGLLHCRKILYQLSHKGSPSTWGLSQNSVLVKLP